MKGVCTSHAATSICLSVDPNSTSSPSSATLLGGGGGGGSGRAIDRHNPIIKDSKRAPKPTSSHPPTTSKKKRNPPIPPSQNENKTDVVDATAIVKKSWSCTNPGDFLSPPGSTRYLLREKSQYNTLTSDSAAEESLDKDVKTEELQQPVPPQLQVVVLRVSLHCRGCERKLRKHLSRMEGVTSFDIDFAAKKVTVAGNVTPLDVVSSISKVKNAQLWSPAISSSSEIKNHDDSKIVVAQISS